ncbi:MAG: hypothetical protein KY467_06455 [Gemmatimonadetes bacterium]|nr:hypothetical protein [Gemmatimonadota bacterium]
MRSIRFLLALAIAGACAAVAAPAHAQRLADVAPGAPWHVHPAPAATTPVVAATRGLPAELRPSSAPADGAAARPLSVAGHVGVGAAAGAVTGAAASLAVFSLWSECRSTGSMCGLAFPFLIGGGAVAGGTVGLVVGLIRNR